MLRSFFSFFSDLPIQQVVSYQPSPNSPILSCFPAIACYTVHRVIPLVSFRNSLFFR